MNNNLIITTSLQHFPKPDPAPQVYELVVDLEHARPESEPHKSADVCEEAVEVVDDVLLLLDVRSLVDGEDEEDVGAPALLSRVRLSLDLQVKLFLLAC